MWRINQQNELIHLDGPNHIVWVPSDQFVFHKTQLPEAKKADWGKMVSFVLEEKLLYSVDDIHFAICDNLEKEEVVVASLPLDLMSQWLELIKANKIKVSKIYPDFLAAPYDSSASAVLWCEDEKCFLRTTEQQIFTGSMNWLYDVAQIHSIEKDIKVFSDGSVDLPQEWHTRSESLPKPLEMLLQEAASGVLPVNLLQGSFKPASLFVEFLKPWYWSGVGVIVLVALFLGELQTKTYALQAQANNIHKANELTLQAYFPEASVRGPGVRNYLTQVMSNLEQSMTEESKGGWKIMLALEPVFNSCKPCRIERFKFDSRGVKIEVSSSNDMAALIESIKKLPKLSLVTEPLQSKDRKKIRLILSMNEEESS